jgi:adenine-specific DNA methylase
MESEFLQFVFDETSVSGPPIGADTARMVGTVRATTFNGANTDDPKALGAFYTDAQVAEFLVWWGIRSGNESVMDPSFGGGVFLRAASKRLLRLGGAPDTQVRGVEVDADVCSRIREKLHDEFGICPQSLVQGNFFSLVCSEIAPVDVVVGNPPFIRYQRFSGEVRSLAFARASEQAVRLSELSSSWVPFLIHSVGFLRRGGRLAMVIPFEMCHASYAVPVLDYLARTFREVTFLTFRKKLFPDLSEDALLLLAEDKAPHQSTRFCVLDLANAGELAKIQAEDRRPIRGTRLLNATDVARGAERLIQSVLPKRATDLYRELRSSHAVRRLGELADVGIGYVTGANDFFHLSAEEVRRWQIPPNFLKKAVRRGRDLSGLRFTLDDWSKSYGHSQAGYLLHIAPNDAVPESVGRYLRQGQATGVNNGFKCRTRKPWYAVPHVRLPNAFLSYMSGVSPKLVANDAGVYAPNTLHILRLHPDSNLAADALAALWQTSLTQLSAEIEGHALGGGMLKLEPSEAEAVLLPYPKACAERLESLAIQLDATARNRAGARARELADCAILRNLVGLSGRDCMILANAAELLRERRYSR